MTDSDKIGVIFSKVGKIETDVALIKQRDETIEARMNSQEGKIAAINEVVMSYKIEKAKLVGMAVASGAIFSAIGAFVFWLAGLLYKHN